MIKEFLDYGIKKELIKKEDEIYVRNMLLAVLNLDEYEEEPLCDREKDLEEILKDILDFAVKTDVIDGSVTQRDLLDTKIMGLLTPMPSIVREKFSSLYEISPESATDYYYKLSLDTDYIRTYRVKKDEKWKADTQFGQMDITINLSKPEKDPKEIAAQKNLKQSLYPKCMLCKENEGYMGRLNHPARQNLRLIPVKINNEDWFFQYSPYVYYNEHCIVFKSEHEPMKIDKNSFVKLLDFVHAFPHYFVGSNADLPIVGGSILSHDHFQGGRYVFSMMEAESETALHFKGYEEVSASIIKWPMSTIKLEAKDRSVLVELSDKILKSWRAYTDESAFVFSSTDGEPHNTITPIACKNGNAYTLYLVLRNNKTTKEHPLGVYHPHSELHHIKKENIGLIEVMGLAVLPSRLKSEMKELADVLVNKKEIEKNSPLSQHATWANMIKEKYADINFENVEKILQLEIGLVFEKVLTHAGVYKCTKEGRDAFFKFIAFVNEN